jgi:hypothetical protein
LVVSFVRVTDLTTRESHTYRLIERIDIEKRYPKRRNSTFSRVEQEEMYFNGCTLSPEFFDILNRVTELMHLDLDVFTRIRSELAQTMYLYLPSRAYHHSELQPFEITVTTLLDQVGFPCPNQRNRRWQLFNQNKRSIIKQLDGIQTRSGNLRIRMAPTSDGKDWKLRMWMERGLGNLRQNPRASKVIDKFLENGWTREDLDRRFQDWEPLTDYETEVLRQAEIDVSKNRRFLELGKALIGRVRFITVIGECKSDSLEGRKAIKNPTARLIWRIMEALPKRSALESNRFPLDEASRLQDLWLKRNDR